jgi:hypothetical protein
VRTPEWASQPELIWDPHEALGSLGPSLRSGAAGKGVSNSNRKIQWDRGEIRRTVETLSKRVKHDVKESGIKTCVVALEVAAKRERRTGKQDDCMSYDCTFACGAGKQYTPVVHVVEGIGLPMVLPARVAGSRCK